MNIVRLLDRIQQLSEKSAMRAEEIESELKIQYKLITRFIEKLDKLREPSLEQPIEQLENMASILREQVEKLKKSLSSDTLNSLRESVDKIDEPISEVRSKVSDLQGQINDLHDYIGESPEKAFAMTVLKRDIDNIRNLLDFKAQEQRVSRLEKIIYGLIMAVLGGIIVVIISRII